MTLPEQFDACRNPACTEHPHCPFDGCGRILCDDGSGVLRCPDGCADALAEGRERAETAR